MAASSSASSWSLINTSNVSCKSQTSQLNPNAPLVRIPIVKIFVGPQLHPFTIHEDHFHKHISGFWADFQQRDFYGQEKSIYFPDGDPQEFEALVKWMEGRKDVFMDQYLYEGLGCKVQELTCFKLFMLAAGLQITDLMYETLDELGECLRGGKWPVTEEAVISAYRSANPNLESLRSRLIYGAMEEFFVGGKVREGLKRARGVDATFDKDVAVAIGYHIMRDVGDCTLDKCYFHHLD